VTSGTTSVIYTTDGSSTSGTTDGSSTSQDSSTSTTTDSSSTSGDIGLTTSYNPNITTTTGGELTSGTSTSSFSTANTSSTTDASSTTGAITPTPYPSTSTTGVLTVVQQQVNLRLVVNGNQSSVQASLFAATVAIWFNVDPSQVSGVAIVPADQKDAPTYTRSVKRASNTSDGNFVCKAVISYDTSSPVNNVDIVANSGYDNNSVVAAFFRQFNATVVSINYTIINATFPSTTALPATTAPPIKPNLSLAVPIGVVVPSVVLIGAGGTFAFVKYRRNRNAAHRARHWDMHNMYSGLSMVDYA